MKTTVNDRIDLRISKEQKELLRFACDLSGFKSLSEFVIFCVNKEANKIIINNNQLLKSINDKKIFVNALLNPASPNSKLKKAQLNYLTFVNERENGVKNKSTRKKSS